MTAHIHWSRVICRRPGRYLAWPTIARTQNGELLVVGIRRTCCGSRAGPCSPPTGDACRRWDTAPA